MHDTEYARRALGHVCIVPPDSAWADQFLQERDRLRLPLGHIADKLEHYGSTAIPGLSAKPIIDMMAPVSSLDQADALDHHLAIAGYRKIDAGFIQRRFFRKEAENAVPAFHLHLAVCTNWPVKNELLLRDWLTQHSKVARAYEALKVELANTYADDMPRYTAGKTSFLRNAVNDARLSVGLPFEQNWDE